MGPTKLMSRVIRTFYNKRGKCDPEQIKFACDHLTKKGSVAVLPTDTLYGLGTRVDDTEGLIRIYDIKGRDHKKPLAVCLDSLDDLGLVADEQGLDRKLLESLLPGPVTLLLKRSQRLNPKLNPGLETIGVRIPDHNFIRSICQNVGPLALTSANRSGESSPIDASDIQDQLPEVEYIFDCGPLQYSVPDANELKFQRQGSTVIDLTRTKRYAIVREGCSLNRSISVLHQLGYRKHQYKAEVDTK